MKIKVSFFDKMLVKKFLSILFYIILLMSFILIFWNIDEDYQMAINITLFTVYILLLIRVNIKI